MSPARRPARAIEPQWSVVASWVELRPAPNGARHPHDIAQRELASTEQAAYDLARAWARDPRLIPGFVESDATSELEVRKVCKYPGGREVSTLVTVDRELFPTREAF